MAISSLNLNIYVQLLNEGTKVYRPVTATAISENVYKILGYDIYDPDIETWEFKPGTLVFGEEQELDGDVVLVAIKELL